MSETETKHPPTYVARSKAEDWFYGLSPRTLANLNAQGLPPKPYKRDRKVFYRYEDLVSFVEGR